MSRGKHILQMNSSAQTVHRFAQDSFDAYINFTQRANVESELPKRHLLVHLLKRADWFGNPRLYATWRDEGLNAVLRNACRHVSQSTFEQNVLANMSQLLLPTSMRVGRRRHN